VRYYAPYAKNDTRVQIRQILPGIAEEICASVDARIAAFELVQEEEKRAKRAASEAAHAALRAQLDEFVSAAGGLLYERWQKGYSSEQEIMEAIRMRDCARRGLSYDDVLYMEGSEWLVRLSDEQFLALKDFLARLPDGARHWLRRWDGGRMVANARWMLGHVVVKATCFLDPPEPDDDLPRDDESVDE
jgi:hypothetical protein